MRILKCKRNNSESNFRNFKRKDICPRCTRSVSETRETCSPGLLSYYKNLCRSSKCGIHRKNASNKKKDKLKFKNIFEKKNSLGRQEKKLRMIAPGIPYQVDEFEDVKSNYMEDVDPDLYTKIENTITISEVQKEIRLENIMGHEILKELINRTIIWPLKKPEIFKGLRSAPRGVLLFGPPGTGKTLLGQCIAFETKSTFFNISASSLTSKWMGESEKLVRTLFLVAKARQPSVIFIDEIDSILSQRTPEENGSSRRMKNEFLLYMDGSATMAEDKIMIIGATTRPQELDEAARRRFFKRLYIPLPDEMDRKEILIKLLECECHSLEEIDINNIVRKTVNYSMTDLKNLCQEAAMGAIKSLSTNAIFRLKTNKIRPISLEDFLCALQLIKPSVSKEQIKALEKWDSIYGYGGEFPKN